MVFLCGLGRHLSALVRPRNLVGVRRRARPIEGYAFDIPLYSMSEAAFGPNADFLPLP